MAAVRGRDTKPEIALRRRLHALGFRYRLNAKSLPGTPDLVLPRHGAVVFVHGCFWHGHDCPLFVVPRTRPDFWLKKIGANQLRDRRNHASLVEGGWRVATVWECAVRGKRSLGIELTAMALDSFLREHLVREMHIRNDGAHASSGYDTLRSVIPKA